MELGRNHLHIIRITNPQSQGADSKSAPTQFAYHPDYESKIKRIQVKTPRLDQKEYPHPDPYQTEKLPEG